MLSSYFTLHFNVIALFGFTLLLGLTGGELARHLRFIPKISGYMAVGFLFGPGCFNLIKPSVLADSRIFINISLGLILFELGRHLDFRWLKADLGLLLTSLVESCTTFVLTLLILHFFHLPWMTSAIIATIAIATSPAVFMMVAHDLNAEGPVTRRTLILTSLNNLIAIVLFILLLPFTKTESVFTWDVLLIGSYRIAASILFGLAVFVMIALLGWLIGKRKENQFSLFIGAIILTFGLSQSHPEISSMLALFTLGAAARNLDFKHVLTEVDFEWLARLFFILLFVVIGAHLQLTALWYSPLIVIAFLLTRLIAKLGSIGYCSKVSRLTSKQAFAISLSLLPMAGIAMGMSNRLIDFNPDLGMSVMNMVAAMVAVLNIIGPILTQFSLIITNEANQASES